MNYDTIEYEQRGPVGIVTLNRPERLNALSQEILDDLNAAMDSIEADDQVRVLVLAGAGRAFCSGFDLKDEAEGEEEGVVEQMPVLQKDYDTIMRLWNFPKPTIAAVHGYAIAGGCELALACDITIAAESSKMGEPDLRFGAGVVVLLLPYLTGPKQAKEIYLTGEDRVSAHRALEMGLINRVVPDGEQLDAALDLARQIAVNDAFSVAITKRAINRCYEMMGMHQALQSALESGAIINNAVLPESAQFMEIIRKEGLKAAIAWRDARFRDD